jgi:predicted Rossmann-fold nucleotide-binding protein
MWAASRAYLQHRRGRGISIGVLPCLSLDQRALPKPGYPNEFVELAIYTHLPSSGEQGTDDLSRNHLNVLSCAALVGLPGDHGTESELTLAVRYRKPVIAFAPTPELIRLMPGSIERTDRIDQVRRFLLRHLTA